MKLTVVIVNYNVRFFLEQCLFSVHKAMQNIETEVFVVDNNSVDGSCAMVKEKFPWVKLIENKKNVGFSAANNQAIRESKGEYALLLNPDTVIEEDTLAKTVAFMDSHNDAGGLGVKMIDGKGNFLPESKRGLPTPSVAFYKVFGLSSLFPKSKTFGKYHLGFLDKEKTHEVEVLSGAFMMLRKSVLDKIGLLDENFFMYGEDIDLSYRILKAGYKNYYFSDTTIIHYKGESTKKGSINYVLVFYKAMIIFARKHFATKNANLFAFMINIAIYFRASISIIRRLFLASLLPVADALLIFAGFFGIKIFWENFRFSNGYYPSEFLYFAVPAYILIWLTSVYFVGGYDKPLNMRKPLKGIIWGTLVILVLYALISEQFRFSRAMLLIGSLWAMLSLTLARAALKSLKLKNFPFVNRRKRAVIVGNEKESVRVDEILKNAEPRPNVIGYVSPYANGFKEPFIGNIDQIKEIIKINKIEEIIFCTQDIPAQAIIRYMLELPEFNTDYKIASPDSFSVIGSNSIHTSGDLYSININSISKPENKRLKRLFDISVSVILIPLLPVLLFVVKNPGGLVVNLSKVLAGIKTWVGFIPDPVNETKLPKLKKCIIHPIAFKSMENMAAEDFEKINMLYAKDYNIVNELGYIIKNLKYLGK